MTEITKSPRTDISKEPNRKYDKDWRLELFALIGFCISGAIFIISGIQNGDFLTILGSSVWIFSCLIWMIPYRKYFNISSEKPDCKYHLATQRKTDV